MLSSHTPTPVFDEPSLTHYAGLAPVLKLATRSGLPDLLTDCLTIDNPNPGLKASTLIAGMLAGTATIDGIDRLRAGATESFLSHPYAPSTIGTFLRSFTHGHTLQLAAICRRFLTRLNNDVAGLIADDGPLLLDLDDTIKDKHGYQQDGVAYGYNKTKGLNALVAAVSTDTSLPVIAEAGLRRGNIKSGDHADWYASRALSTLSTIGPDRNILSRADSAFCTHALISTLTRAGVWYSITTPQWATVSTAIAAIPDDGWTPIKYTHAIYDEDEHRWVSDAEVAEIDYTAFSSRKTDDHITCRLVVRRVKRRHAGQRDSEQGELFDTYRYHPFLTNSPYTTIEADRRHRQHAVIEQVIAELKNGPLAGMPSADFSANAAWVQFAAMTFNLSRAAAVAAGMATARMATVKTVIITVAARIVTHARQARMRLIKDWPWQDRVGPAVKVSA